MSKEVDTQTNATIDSRPRTILPTVLPTPNTSTRNTVRSSLAALQAVSVGEALEPTEGEAALRASIPCCKPLQRKMCCLA